VLDALLTLLGRAEQGAPVRLRVGPRAAGVSRETGSA
jgi:hypothetical protein